MRTFLRPRILKNLSRKCDNTAYIAPTNAQKLIPQRCHSTSTSLSTKPRTWSLRPSQSTAQFPPSRRSFINLSDILQNANSNGNNNNNSQEIRTLRATRTLPFPPSPLYEIISSVESYSEFLPFLAASTVTARDPESGYPSQAFLTVGYGPFKETFTSRVTCDRERWIVEARSGGGVGDDGRPVPGADEGLFSHLSTKWQLVPETSKEDANQQVTHVQLEIRFRFQNAMHTAMMGAVEDKVAAAMIEAFERRIKEQMVPKL